MIELGPGSVKIVYRMKDEYPKCSWLTWWLRMVQTSISTLPLPRVA